MAIVEIPQILKFTVLPYRLTARAWVDEIFKGDLLRNPKTFLVGHSTYFPRDCSYVIHPDSASIRHYPVPFIPNSLEVDQKALLATIEAEMGDASPFDTWLPAPVMYKALTDPEYLSQLSRRAVSFLRSEGYRAPTDIAVIQNSSTTFNIPLRFNGAMHRSFESALLEIRGDAAVISSSGCCASGTCC